jgi:hypothetical protein
LLVRAFGTVVKISFEMAWTSFDSLSNPQVSGIMDEAYSHDMFGGLPLQVPLVGPPPMGSHYRPFSRKLSLNSSSGKPDQSSPGRKRFSAQQAFLLETEFQKNPKPDRETRERLSMETALPLKNIQIWFQNRRAKARAQQKQEAFRNFDETEWQERVQFSSTVPTVKFEDSYPSQIVHQFAQAPPQTPTYLRGPSSGTEYDGRMSVQGSPVVTTDSDFTDETCLLTPHSSRHSPSSSPYVTSSPIFFEFSGGSRKRHKPTDVNIGLCRCSHGTFAKETAIRSATELAFLSSPLPSQTPVCSVELQRSMSTSELGSESLGSERYTFGELLPDPRVSDLRRSSSELDTQTAMSVHSCKEEMDMVKNFGILSEQGSQVMSSQFDEGTLLPTASLLPLESQPFSPVVPLPDPKWVSTVEEEPEEHIESHSWLVGFEGINGLGLDGLGVDFSSCEQMEFNL